MQHQLAKGCDVLYYLYELNQAVLGPARVVADAGKKYFSNPLNPISHTLMGKSAAASLELFERGTRRYGKPSFGIEEVMVDGEPAAVFEHVVWKKPFCNLIHFAKYQRPSKAKSEPLPKVLMVAPMSGHYATLLRGTVEAMLPDHDVYITDWVDARQVPVSSGSFDLDDYVDYLMELVEYLGEDLHIMAVCQPSVPVLAAVSRMEAEKRATVPSSMILMGGPIDTRVNPTAVNEVAEEKGLDWFSQNVIVNVPPPNPGLGRRVYPGFLQLTGFMSMNLDRHMMAHYDFFNHLIEGDGDSVDKHMEFYDEYLAVMDLTEEFYLQTVQTVFVDHALPNGKMTHRNHKIDPSKITRVSLMTIEGEHDDISGVGQTKAAHKLCSSLSDEQREHYVQPGVGHYGVFNGSRFRKEIAPRISQFIRNQEAPAKVKIKLSGNRKN